MWTYESDLPSFETYVEALILRPDPLDGIALPTVRNIQEAEFINAEFEAVITAGPAAEQCDWAHPNHGVWTFDDTEGRGGPTHQHVEEMLAFGLAHEDLLIHCHAGISRSTATAWGVAMAKGADPEGSFRALIQAHPEESFAGKRPFSPNRLLVAHLQDILGYQDLLAIRDRVLREDGFDPWWL